MQSLGQVAVDAEVLLSLAYADEWQLDIHAVGFSIRTDFSVGSRAGWQYRLLRGWPTSMHWRGTLMGL